MQAPPLVGIVDDDPHIPAALGSFIRSLGYHAECFSSAEALLNSDVLQTLTCLISDIHMPKMSGVELVPEVHRLRPGLPIILMTGRFEQGLRERALGSGATAFVNKPFSLDELLEIIQKAIGAK